MNKARKHFYFAALVALPAIALGTCTIARGVDPIAFAKAVNASEYTLSITKYNAFDEPSRYYSETELGKKVLWTVDDAGALPEGHLVQMRASGSGVYFTTPIQTVTSITVTFDVVGTLEMYFDKSFGAFDGDTVTFTSGVPFSAPSGYESDVYLSIWGNLNTYIDSIEIVYTCR